MPAPSFSNVRGCSERLLGACPGGVAGKGPLPEGKTRARVPRGRPRGALAAAVGALRVRDVDRAQVRLAGLVQWRRRAPVLGGPGDGLPRGRRRDGLLRRRGRRARRRGLGAPRARVGRRDSAVGRSPPDGRLLPRLRGAGKTARRPARAPRRRVEARQAAAVEGAVCSLGAAGGVDAATPPVLRVLVDARPRAGVAGALEAGRTAQAGRDSRAQGRRGPRLVPRPASGGLGLRGDTLARLRRAGGGPGLPRPYRPRQDPRSHRARRRGDPLRHPGQVPPAASLVLRLGKAKREGALDRLVADIGQASLVMLDEFGTFPSKSTWPACPTRP